MAANVQPIHPLVVNNTPSTFVTLTTANTAMDGTGTVGCVFLAGSNGARLDGLRVKALGTNVATVLRVFVNNSLTNATAANNCLISEVTIPATTASNTAATTNISVPLDVALQAGFKVNVTIGTSIASGITIFADGGNY